MQMNMLGMVHTGVDVCGFYEYDNERTELDEELCLRWLQLTTVLPLARHTQSDSDPFPSGPLAFKKESNKIAAK